MKYSKSQIAQSGFTLIEMLVATAVFALVMGAVIGLFVFFIKAPLQQAQEKQLEAELAFFMDGMAKNIRTSRVDYSSYTAISYPTDDLYLLDQDGSSQEHYYLCTAILVSAGTCSPQDTVVLDDGSGITQITTNNIVVEELKFFIYPDADPIGSGGSYSNNQPTVLMFIKGTQEENGQTAEATYQTLVTTRYYAR